MARVISALQRAELVAADSIAVTCGSERLTYAQTAERCRRLGGALYWLGLERGDRVGVIGPNCHRYLELYMGVPGAGLSVVPLNSRHTAAELRYALDDGGVRVLFTAIDIPDLPECVEHVFDLGDGYEALLRGAEPREFEDGDEDEVAGLFYTGGTTGASKGVMLTHRNLVANAMHFQTVWEFRPDTVWLVAAPLFHAAGSVAVLSTVYNAGAQVVLPAFDPAAGLDLMAEHAVTHTLVVPTMLAAFNEEQLARPRALPALRGISHGGSPIATETLRRAAKAFGGVELLHLYGATETAPLATSSPHEEDHLDDPVIRSCGQPVVGVDIRIGDPMGRSLPAREVGEVMIRGANVMRGYWNKPEQTADVLVDGWYRSGDLGYMDEHGFVYLVDRAKDMIVTGGENVYGTEVEEALYAHEGVLEAAVFGVPDERWGEAVHAVVVPRDGGVDPDELIEHCRIRIAGYKVPKVIEIREEPLPKSGAGKVLKRELRAPFWAEREGEHQRVMTDAVRAYETVTDGLRRPVRITELVYSGADGLPTREQINAEREHVQKDKQGLEIAQGDFVARVFADPRCGAHLIHSMAQPTAAALEALPGFVETGSVDLGPMRVDRADRVGVVTIQNHSCLNAEDDASTQAMEVAVDLVLLDDGIDVGVVRGAPAVHEKYAGRRIFGAGINLTALYNGQISFVEFMVEREVGTVHKMLRGHPLGAVEDGDAEERREKPWIAAVESFAIGGACQWLLVMDRVIAQQGSYFNLPARKEGIIPGCANLRLPRFVGERMTRQAIFFNRAFAADSEEGMLLCDEVVPEQGMDAAIAESARELLSAGTISLVANRRALRAGQEPLEAFRNYLSVYAREQARCLYSPALIDNLERNWLAVRS